MPTYHPELMNYQCRDAEIAARNARNRDLWTARMAWSEHTSDVLPDPRNLDQQILGMELRRRSLHMRHWLVFDADIELALAERADRPVRKCGEIEAEYSFCDEEPKLIWARLQRGLTAGIGDAPGTVRVLDCGYDTFDYR